VKNTEEHLREMLSERADRVRPRPVPEDVTREAARPAHRVRFPGLLAAAAVVAVVAVATLVPLLAGGPEDGPDEESAPAASSSGTPTPHARSSKLPATSRHPAAGVCARVGSSVVTIRVEPDVPLPRCAQVRPDQSLRVVNRTGDDGQQAHRVRVRWIPGSPVTLAPGESHTFPRRFGDYLRPGVHELRITRAYGAEIWLR
jgi:hypothetical protein